MKPGELWECLEPEKACCTTQVEAFTLNWTSQFRRLYKPFILLESITSEDEILCAWKVMSELGIVYVHGALKYFAHQVGNEAG